MNRESSTVELSALTSSSEGLIRPHHSKLLGIVRMLDGAAISMTLYLAVLIFHAGETQIYSIPAAIAVLVFIFFAEYLEVYSLWRGSSLYRESLRILAAWVATASVLAITVFAFKLSGNFSRLAIATWLVAAPATVLTLHVLRRKTLAALRKRGRNTRTFAVVAANNLGKRITNSITDMNWLGYQFAGYYDDRAYAEQRRLGVEHVGSIEGGLQQLIDDVKARKVDLVYITLPMAAEKRIQKLIQQLADTTASVFLVPDFNVFDPVRARWDTLQGIPVVSVYDTPFQSFDAFLKRAEDVVLGSLILSLIAIPMLFIAIAVKVTSPGPVLFKQRRYGIAGEEIEVWKFRSMSVCEDGAVVKQATKNDKRVTPLGGFLRRTSLDELPQFINVLQGTMSIVGPRPHAVSHNEYYRLKVQGYMLRHKVKPGITGLAQINGCRGETDTDEKMNDRVRYDLNYIKHWSLFLDLKIIFLTIFKGFVGKTAY